jgi:[acyl-carrier-protein] S-malonyltransferase
MAAEKNKIMFLFPGQGSQYRGIGSDLFDQFKSVREIYSRASKTVGYDIAELSFRDPEGVIDLTRNTQPVLMTHSIACLELFKQETGGNVKPHCAGGHSLGEYTALVASGALEFETGLQLVKRRGELMGEFGEGEMLAFPLAREMIEPIAGQHYCGVAACNLQEQTVIGGRSEDLDTITEIVGQQFPKKRAARLKTEGAFHTYYMVTAAGHFRRVLEEAEIQLPTIDVLSNFTGGFHQRDIAAIRSRLFMQLFCPVMWYSNLVAAVDHGVDTFIEFGGGIGKGESAGEKRPNLEGIVKRAFRGEESPPQHYPAINCESLEKTITMFSV